MFAPDVKAAFASVKPADFTDSGNAEVFVKTYRDELIYTDALGWLWWNGKRWERDDHKPTRLGIDLAGRMLEEAKQENRAANRACADAKSHYEESDSPENNAALTQAQTNAAVTKEYLKHATKSRNAALVSNMLKLSIPSFVIDTDKLDADPFALNTPAGIVHLLTGDIRPHDRKALCSQMTACAPGTQGAEVWENFLDTITCQDDSMKGFLQTVAGMALIGKVYHEGIVMAYGGGRNGKSTFFNALGGVLGDYSGGIDVKTLTTDRQNRGASLATLRGKRLVITGELEEHQRLSVATLKQIASTDRITIEEKFKAPVEITPSHSLVLFTNFLPRIGSTDGGTWRRLCVVPFNATIPSDGGVQNYGELLVAQAGPAILQWAIDGAILFYQNRFRLPTPEAVEEATDAYREREDWVNNFLSECCVCTSPYDRTQSRKLYEAYKQWAESVGDYVRRERDFSEGMQRAGYNRTKSHGAMVYWGIALQI